MRTQLSPLFEATRQVAEQNLDFEVRHSKIKEFEDVLCSFANMKDNLKISLEKQWNAEQLQREQIAALAHDLKTPLTVIQGNIDLINETELDDEQRLYAGYITESVFLEILMYAADWTNRCGGNTIQSYFSWNQYRAYYLCGLFRTQHKKTCSCYCRNAGFGRCAASYGL